MVDTSPTARSASAAAWGAETQREGKTPWTLHVVGNPKVEWWFNKMMETQGKPPHTVWFHQLIREWQDWGQDKNTVHVAAEDDEDAEDDTPDTPEDDKEKPEDDKEKPEDDKEKPENDKEKPNKAL